MSERASESRRKDEVCIETQNEKDHRDPIRAKKKINTICTRVRMHADLTFENKKKIDLLCSANDDYLLARVCTCARDAPQEARSQEAARAGSTGGGTGAEPA